MEDPGGLVLRRAEAARDVRQGDVGDGGVEHLHESGEGDRHGDDPWVLTLGRHCLGTAGGGWNLVQLKGGCGHELNWILSG